MLVPECPDCGAIHGIGRDVASGTNPRLTWREVQCVDCKAKRKLFSAYLPDEMAPITLYELSADRMLHVREKARVRRNPGPRRYHRTDRMIPAEVTVNIAIRRFPRPTPLVGNNANRIGKAEYMRRGRNRHRLIVTATPLMSEECG